MTARISYVVLSMNASLQEDPAEILTISHKSGHGHIPTSFLHRRDAVRRLRDHAATIRKPGWHERDLFVLSKGHASLGFYCVLAVHGYFRFEEVYAFGAFHSNFGCHPDRLKVPGVEASTGSLGHGIGARGRHGARRQDRRYIAARSTR